MQHSNVTTYHVGSFSVSVQAGQSHSAAWSAALKRHDQMVAWKPVSNNEWARFEKVVA